jgi:hypothetical protein
MTSTIGRGRLGNQIIRNMAVSLIAEKHNLAVDYYNKDLINKLGIELFSGSNNYEHIHDLTDNNYFYIYNCDNLNCNLQPNSSFFQTKEITKFLYNYLHTEKVKSSIIAHNQFNHRYNNNNDLYIHIRLTDAARYNPGITYYVNAIKKKNMQFDKLYISTDEPTHPTIIELFQLYPSAQLIEYDEISTFQFASTCKHIVLSHGSFSAMIGYLAYFSTIYYPEYESDKIWYGDMFSIDNWTKLNVK